MDNLVDTFLACICEAADMFLPHTGYPRRHQIPGWNDSVREIKNRADFWHRIWCEAGSPASGTLFQIKKIAKSR